VSWLDTLNNSAKFITEVFGAPPEDPDPEDTNEAPSDIHLITGGSAASVDEHKTGGTVVATVTADDDGGAAGLRYSLTDNTFEIDPVTGQIRVKAGAVLDYERAGSHTLSVTVTDKNGTGLSATQTITIKVRDLLESQLGTSAKNALVGGIGADKINGGSGNDVLTGGLGADVFVFDTALGRGTTARNHNKKVNFDTITDFKPGEDKIWLDNKIFTKLGRAGSEAAPAALNKKFFKKSKATDKDDYLVYKSGVVYYDQDGKGAKYKPVEIIKIANKVALSAADFLVI
jgi:Ca2+-binding RTX toxin-like protein